MNIIKYLLLRFYKKSQIPSENFLKTYPKVFHFFDTFSISNDIIWLAYETEHVSFSLEINLILSRHAFSTKKRITFCIFERGCNTSPLITPLSTQMLYWLDLFSIKEARTHKTHKIRQFYTSVALQFFMVQCYENKISSKSRDFIA